MTLRKFVARRGRGRIAVVALAATAATGAWATGSSSGSPDDDPTIPTYYPTPTRHYMKDSIDVCDQGSFFVGGMLKKTYYERSSVRSTAPQVVMIGQMYVQFQIPMRYNDWPVIFVSGGAHTGASLESTPDGREGWAPYTFRHDIPTFVVDQSGRGRSGFDISAIHEGVAKLTDADPSNDADGRALIPNTLVLGTADWWQGTFGHLVNPATGQPTNGPGTASVLVDQLVPHGWSSADPDAVTVHNPGVMTQFPIHATSPEVIPPNLIPKGEQVPGALAGPDEFYHLNYWRQLVPNTEQTLPSGTCPTCVPTTISAGGFASGHTWTPVNIAELIEQLGKIYGGVVLATHSQSGPVGPHAIRYLKQHGTLKYLKGLITVEGTPVTLANAGLTVEDFDTIPFLVVKGDYSVTSAPWQAIVDSLIARRKAGQGKAAVEYIKLDEAPNIANAWPYALKRPVMEGVTHMMMDGSDEGRGYDSSDIMQMILNWGTAHISKMRTTIACRRDDRDDHHCRWWSRPFRRWCH
jgi:hypothetical protein